MKPFIQGANTTWQTPLSLDQVKQGNNYGSVESPSPITNEPPSSLEVAHVSNPNTHG